MKALFTTFAVALLSLPMLVAQNTVTIDANATYTGFMVVNELDGTFVFASPWGFGDLQSSTDMDAGTLILQPNFNTYRDNPGDAFWINLATGEGNKQMIASTFVEVQDGSLANADLTFNGTVQSWTLDPAYSVKFFVKALDPDNNFADVLGGAFLFDLPSSGTFTTTVPAMDIMSASLFIQYGFEVTGPNANPDMEAALGNVTLAAFSTSTDELTYLERQIGVFPNPADDLLNITSEAPVRSYQISNLMGQQLLQGTGTNQVDISALPTGNYLITVDIEEGRRALRFVKR